MTHLFLAMKNFGDIKIILATSMAAHDLANKKPASFQMSVTSLGGQGIEPWITLMQVYQQMLIVQIRNQHLFFCALIPRFRSGGLEA
jgi:hypothetical protein